jgi:hypothetical protein
MGHDSSFVKWKNEIYHQNGYFPKSSIPPWMFGGAVVTSSSNTRRLKAWLDSRKGIRIVSGSPLHPLGPCRHLLLPPPTVAG